MSRPQVRIACDSCRRRKIRCNLDQPCLACQQAGLRCTFLSTRQKKGRKGETANVISELRNSQAEATRYAVPSSPIAGQNFNYTSPTVSLDLQTSPQILDALPRKSSFTPNAELLPLNIVDICTELFFSQMRTTVPVLTRESIREASSAMTGSNNHEESYCLITAFCAFVILQTGAIELYQLLQLEIHHDPATYGQLLLREALSLRSHLNLLGTPTLPIVLLTFFIYGCHSALGKHKLAWFFLREATTLYTSAALDSDDEVVDITFNRIFWLLLISERYYVRRPSL